MDRLGKATDGYFQVSCVTKLHQRICHYSRRTICLILLQEIVELSQVLSQLSFKLRNPFERRPQRPG